MTTTFATPPAELVTPVQAQQTPPSPTAPSPTAPIALVEHAAFGDGTDCPFELPEAGVNMESVERGLIAQALHRTNGNQSRAARLLGISRYALRYRMQKFNLTAAS